MDLSTPISTLISTSIKISPNYFNPLHTFVLFSEKLSHQIVKPLFKEARFLKDKQENTYYAMIMNMDIDSMKEKYPEAFAALPQPVDMKTILLNTYLEPVHNGVRVKLNEPLHMHSVKDLFNGDNFFLEEKKAPGYYHGIIFNNQNESDIINTYFSEEVDAIETAFLGTPLDEIILSEGKWMVTFSQTFGKARKSFVEFNFTELKSVASRMQAIFGNVAA